MYNRLFWSKYLFRVMHISTLTIISSQIIWKKLFQTENQDPPIYIQWILSIIMIISGFINTSLLDPQNKMKQHSNQWIGMMHFKLLSSICLMTPIINYILENDIILEIRFGFIMFWLLVSPFLRFYREFWTEHYRNVPQQLQMVQFQQISE